MPEPWPHGSRDKVGNQVALIVDPLPGWDASSPHSLKNHKPKAAKALRLGVENGSRHFSTDATMHHSHAL
jgi:hypothetical protein